MSAETSTTAAKEPAPDYGPYTVHPAAELFPFMSPDELQDLADDIKKHGLQNPIKLLGDTNQIIDGRNRYLACKLAGIEPTFERLALAADYDAYDYTVSQNVLRRQLTVDNRREVVKKLRGQGKSIRDIAQTMNVPKSTISDDITELSETGQLEEPEQIEGLDKKKRSPSKPKGNGAQPAKAKRKNYTGMADGVADKINAWLRPDQNITQLIEELIGHRREVGAISWENLVSVIGLQAKRARELGLRMWDGSAKELEELLKSHQDED